MFKQEKNYVVVSLDEQIFKIVHFKGAGSDTRVVGAVKADVQGLPDEELAKTVKGALSGFGSKKIVAFYAVPVTAATTKNIEIPSVDPEEIRSIIDLQAGRHTPYSREEILVGYVKIGVFQRNYTKILLIIINRNAIKKHLELFGSAGLQTEKVLFAPEGMTRFYGNILKRKDDDIPVGIIDIAHQTTTFAIEFNKTVSMCRSIPIGMNHLIKEGPDAKNKLIVELSQSIESYQNEDINTLPEMYILTSDDGKIKELQPVLQEKLKAKVQVMPFLEKVQAPQELMLKLVSEYNDHSFLDVIGPGMTASALAVDLTPEEVKVQRQIEQKGREVIKAGVFSIVSLVFICGIFFTKIYFHNTFLGRLTEEYIAKRRQVVALDRVAHKTRIIKDFINTRLVSLDVIRELYNLTPDEIYLQNVFLDENGTITIQGISDTMSIVFSYVNRLEKSELFKQVKPRSTTDTKDRGKDVAAFDIEFRLESAEAPPPEEATEESGNEEAAP